MNLILVVVVEIINPIQDGVRCPLPVFSVERGN